MRLNCDFGIDINPHEYICMYVHVLSFNYNVRMYGDIMNECMPLGYTELYTVYDMLRLTASS